MVSVHNPARLFFETSKLLCSRCLCNGKRPRSRNTGGRTGKEELSSTCLWALLVCLKWQIPFQSQQRETGAPGSHLPACGCARAGPGWLQAVGGSCRDAPRQGTRLLGNVEVCKEARWSCTALIFFCLLN